MKGSTEINPFNSMEGVIEEMFPEIYEINQLSQGGTQSMEWERHEG